MQLCDGPDAALAAAVLAVNAVKSQNLREGNDASGQSGQPGGVAIGGATIHFDVRNRHDGVEEALSKRIAAGRRTDVVAVVADLFARLHLSETVARQQIAERLHIAVHLSEVELYLDR